MARVSIFQGGNVQSQGVTNARQRPADFGDSPLASGMQQIGKIGTEVVDKVDQLEDVRARVETNRLAVEHSELTRGIGQRVKQSLGEGAEAAANAGAEELNKGTQALIGRASPRAKLLLENELRQRSISATDGWLTHGFTQKADAFESSSVARIGVLAEDAADLDDEAAGLALLGQANEVNARRAQFFGKGSEWVAEQNSGLKSKFFASRALKIATSLGENGGAHAAIQYATKNRANMADDDYNRIVNAYDEEAIKDWAFARANGYDPNIIGVVEDKATPAAVAEANDPLAPLPQGAVQQTAEGKPVVAARANHADVFANLIVPNEGTAYVIDNNGAGVKYGINAAFNPGVDVKNLTQAGAAAIFKKKYWDDAGCNDLPPQLAAMHADTYYLNPSRAKRILRDSGGDPDRYMALRREFLGGLHASNPAKYPNYESRNKRVEAYADRLGDGGALPQIDVSVNMSSESIKDKVFATPGVGMRLKRAYYSALIEQKQGLRQEREETEGEASRVLTTAMVQLGDNFTSLTQLPQNALLSASPSTLSAVSNAMKNNKENTPLPLNVQAQVAFTAANDATAFLKPEVQNAFIKAGGTTKQLGELVQAGAKEAGLRAKPGNEQPLAGSTLMTIARPHLKAAGIELSSLDESAGDKNKTAKPEERARDAQRQLAVIGYLSERQSEWRSDPKNAGRHPPEELVRKWTGWAILKTRDGRYAFEASDAEIYTNLPQSTRSRILRDLYGNGPRPSGPERIRDVVDIHQKELTLSGR